MNQLLERFEAVRLPDAAQALRHEIRHFLSTELPPNPIDQQARSWMGFNAEFSQKLASRGWVGVTLPRAYGGAEMDAFGRYVLVEELLMAGAPVSAHWIADRQSAPLIHKFGSEAQRRFYLPRICHAQAFFCIGMSEPDAGSDLASVGSRAKRRPDGGWTLTGRKIWTTHAHLCHYMIALVRTSGTSQHRHEGLSQFIVDLSLPGITIRPILDLAGDSHFSEVFFDDVELHEDALIGKEGEGWRQVTAELAFERSGPERIYSSIVLLDAWIQALRNNGDDMHTQTLGRLITHLAALRGLSLSVTARLAKGESPTVEAALVKDLGTTFEQEIPTLVNALIFSDPGRQLPAALVRTCAYLCQISPTFSLRGGTREVLRGVIARGLGLR